MGQGTEAGVGGGMGEQGGEDTAPGCHVINQSHL